MSIEIINEPMPTPQPSGKPRIKGHMKLVYVDEASQKILKETVTDGWAENERRMREDAHLIEVITKKQE
jgi:hypothetical protein